jgi:hypothetical protein
VSLSINLNKYFKSLLFEFSAQFNRTPTTVDGFPSYRPPEFPPIQRPQIPPSEEFPIYRPQPQPQPPVNEFPTTTQNEVETFFEIGGPSSRLKREIKFPDDDDVIVGNVTNIQNESEKDVEEEFLSIEGRALKQTFQSQSITKVDVGIQSQLFVTPGSSSIVYFDVTNLRTEPTYYSFLVQDEKRYLRAMEPRL